MSTAIGGLNSAAQFTRAITSQQSASAKVDSDGDHDGSKPGEIEQSTVSSSTTSTVGTLINTTA